MARLTVTALFGLWNALCFFLWGLVDHLWAVSMADRFLRAAVTCVTGPVLLILLSALVVVVFHQESRSIVGIAIRLIIVGVLSNFLAVVALPRDIYTDVIVLTDGMGVAGLVNTLPFLSLCGVAAIIFVVWTALMYVLTLIMHMDFDLG